MFTSTDNIKYKAALIIPDLKYPWRNNGKWLKVLLTNTNMTLQFTYLGGYILHLLRWWKTKTNVRQRLPSFISKTYHHTKAHVFDLLKIHRFSRIFNTDRYLSSLHCPPPMKMAFYLFFLMEITGMTLDNKIIKVSGIQFY